MLSSLSIKNVALIPSVKISFSEGLNVLTGETGAGKSIVVGSLNFILGAKVDKSMVRYGERFAEVTAVFENSVAATDVLNELGLEAEDIIVICRTLTDEGRSDVRINGKTVSLSMLRTVASRLVDIHGQHEHQKILKAANHMEIIDYFGRQNIAPIKARVEDEYRRLKDLKRQLDSFGGTDAERERAADFLLYQIEEISQAELCEEEEKTLKAKRMRFINLSRISAALEIAAAALSGDENGGVCPALGAAAGALSNVAVFDEELDVLAERLRTARLEMSDIADDIEGRLNSLDYDAATADAVENRLEIYKNMTRKYGGSTAAVLEFLDAARQKYDNLINSAERVDKIKKQIEIMLDRIYALCRELTVARVAAAESFADAVMSELKDLGMNPMLKAQFRDYNKEVFLDYLSAEGADSAEFYFSANAGEPVKPLGKVISGGELSRLMLAIKNVAAQDGTPTMIFDEIDTGISGKTGQVVANKMASISRRHQVLCVTHLAQLAAMADKHYLISKDESDGKTITSVAPLNADGEIEEIARLSGGKEISSVALLHAKNLKGWSDNYKKSLQNT